MINYLKRFKMLKRYDKTEIIRLASNISLSKDIENSEDDQLNLIFKMIHLTNAFTALKQTDKAHFYIQKIDKLTKEKEDKRMNIRISEMKSAYFKLIKKLMSFHRIYMKLVRLDQVFDQFSMSFLMLTHRKNSSNLVSFTSISTSSKPIF